jgi:hypothetical protein
MKMRVPGTRAHRVLCQHLSPVVTAGWFDVEVLSREAADVVGNRSTAQILLGPL